MRALITGGYGFVGRHLAGHLVKCGDDVAVSYYPKKKTNDPEGKVQGEIPDEPELESLMYESGLPLPKTVQCLALDVTNQKAVNDVISLLKPDAIYHLAALTFVPDAERAIAKVLEINTLGTLYLLEAVAKYSPKSRILAVSSSEVYGDPSPGDLPLTEQAMLRPVSIYGVTKASAELASLKYTLRENLFIVRVRPFPHLGPGQSPLFAVSSFAKQLAAIKLGKEPPVLKVGNLEVKRDLTDVADIIRGYREALLNGKRGEVYNLCSGTSISIREVMEKLIKIAEVKVTVQVQAKRQRTGDIQDIWGSSQKANKDFGWKPRIELDGTLHSLFAYWVEELS